MVADALLGWLYDLVNGLWSLVPSWTIAVDEAAIMALRFEISKWDGWLPITSLVAIINATVSLTVAWVTLRSLWRIVGILRGGGG